eukprot:494943_1
MNSHFCDTCHGVINFFFPVISLHSTIMMAFKDDIHSQDERISIIRSVDICSSDEFVKPINLNVEQHKLSPPTILFHHHSALLTITNTFLAVGVKCFPAFVTFVLDEYDFTYSFVTRSLAIASFTTMICLLLLPQLLYFRANITCFIICIIACVGSFVLWYFRHNEILFIVGLSLISNTFQLQWGSSNAIISSFVNRADAHTSHKYLSSLSGAWTYATFLFIAVGYIVKFASFWSYLECMCIAFGVLALLNLWILPPISVNQYNQRYHSPNQKDTPISICGDFKILSGIKVYRVILLMLALAFIAWSLFYASFGLWIQEMYNLDEAELGVAAALIEGIGNLVAIVLITYFAINNQSNDRHRCKMKLDKMITYFAMLLVFSVGGMTVINYAQCLQFLLKYNLVVYALICGYFCGSEGVIVGGMILSVTETPQSQQARSSAFVSIINSVCLFTGQFAVGIIYTKGGFKLETPILLGIQVLLVLVSIYLAYCMRYSRIRAELFPLNKHFTNSYM